MSGVVLRCENFGTTSATAGERQACREAEVRFFCTNHPPGNWLDTPVLSRWSRVRGPSCPSVGAFASARSSSARTARPEAPTNQTD